MATLVLRALSGALLIALTGAVHAGEWRYDGTASGPPPAPEPMAQQEAPMKTAMALPLPAPRTPGMELPRSGIKLDKVRAQFGPPQQEIPAVGDPPILRWRYPDYIVYFEYDLVITSVPIEI